MLLIITILFAAGVSFSLGFAAAVLAHQKAMAYHQATLSALITDLRNAEERCHVLEQAITNLLAAMDDHRLSFTTALASLRTVIKPSPTP